MKTPTPILLRKMIQSNQTTKFHTKVSSTWEMCKNSLGTSDLQFKIKKIFAIKITFVCISVVMKEFFQSLKIGIIVFDVICVVIIGTLLWNRVRDKNKSKKSGFSTLPSYSGKLYKLQSSRNDFN